MITGELKNRIDSLWDIFAAGGLVNPPRRYRADNLSYVYP